MNAPGTSGFNGKIARIAGISYLIIFFTAIYANFFVLEALKNAPAATVAHQNLLVRSGSIAFLLTVVFDVVVAWALYLLFRKHYLSGISTLFRMMHAAIMGTAIFALARIPELTTGEAILEQLDLFNRIWLIGLFFFGIHLVLLGRILKKPRWIAIMLTLAGLMYITDTSAHFLMKAYDSYAEIFLLLVALPSILGEMSLAVWLLIPGEKNS